ncbi:CBS domain-containing protein [Candidatus Binatia bacterium]|nr:CBS domain-containing protein [Candidatus Binatia bacterium]
MLDVGKICSRDVDLVDTDESAYAAAKRMQARGVGTLVVIDAERRPCGIVTDRDLVTRVLATSRDPETTWVRDLLSAPVSEVPADASLEETVRTMRRAHCRRLVVVDAQRRLVGIVSVDDVLAVMAEQMHAVAALLESEAPHALDGEIQLAS